jgi:hypothetical protein
LGVRTAPPTSAPAWSATGRRIKLSNLNNLEIDVSALYLIAAPKTPDDRLTR